LHQITVILSFFLFLNNFDSPSLKSESKPMVDDGDDDGSDTDEIAVDKDCEFVDYCHRGDWLTG
jgi:hypothetical protein